MLRLIYDAIFEMPDVFPRFDATGAPCINPSKASRNKIKEKRL
jgi:hypothetical protein